MFTPAAPWTQQAKIAASGSGTVRPLGGAVAVSGNTVGIGARLASFMGAVYVHAHWYGVVAAAEGGSSDLVRR
jgi:hypothetical protein